MLPCEPRGDALLNLSELGCRFKNRDNRRTFVDTFRRIVSAKALPDAELTADVACARAGD